MLLHNVIILGLIMIVNSTFFYLHVHWNYNDLYSNIYNTSIAFDQSFIIFDYDKTNWHLHNTICNQNDMTTCLSNIDSYLANDYLKNNTYYNTRALVIGLVDGNKNSDVIIESIQNLINTNLALYIISWLYVATIILLKYSNQSYCYRPTILAYTFIIEILCILFSHFDRNFSAISNNGFRAGGRIHGINSEYKQVTNYFPCDNNLNCFGSIYNLWSDKNVDWIVVDSINKYDNTFDIVTLFPWINIPVLVMFFYSMRHKADKKYELIY